MAFVDLFLAIASVLSAVAQSSKGIIAGIVRDKTGAVISGTKITVTSQETSETRAVVADERGAYRIDAVNSGHYSRTSPQAALRRQTRDLNVLPSIVTTYDPVLDTNGDGSTANDRPLVGNPHQPIDTVGFDGSYVGGSPGVYCDGVTGNPTTADNVHWLVPNGPQFTSQEVGRNSFVNPNAQYWNIAAEKDVPTSWLHFDRGMFVFRVEAQNFTNHNNIGPLDINLLHIGTSSFLNKQNAVEPTFRHLLLWQSSDSSVYRAFP